MAQTPTPVALTDTGAGAGAGAGADEIGAAAAMSNKELEDDLGALFSQMAALQGKILARFGEVERRQSFREQGATSTESWAAERFGISTTTARGYARVGAKAWDIPHLVGSLVAGEVSLDKVRAVADVATAETDRELCAQAKKLSVRELADVARTTAQRAAARSNDDSRSGDDRRSSLRFNDTFRTMTLQLPAPEYAETKAVLEAQAKKVPSDGETPWDERLADAHFELIRSSAPGASGRASTVNPTLVVLHVPLDALVDDEVEDTELAGELEHNGLVDVATVHKLSCDATVAVAVDDDVGHTMYEGRARRFPNEGQRREVMRRDRHCRFPGCDAETFINVHHVIPWKPTGRTDLSNLALLCIHHHALVHKKGWSMTGNANEELNIVGPTGRVMTSRPSPLWTTVADWR